VSVVDPAAEPSAVHATRVLRFHVRDDGPGMEPEVVARIFEPFYSTRSRGTGLGLAITRSDVEDLGGTVSCRSASGQGTTFTLDVPVSQDVTED
jgi:two-component system sensor histidine kinase FlrB